MEKKRQLLVIYFDSNKIQLYSKVLKNTLELSLTSDIISDLEVINSEKLESAINNFFTINNLKEWEFDCILIFSENTIFEKDLEQRDSKLRYDETQKFLEMVPFEDILSNSYTFGKKTKVVAVNKTLFESLRYDFEKNKARILTVIPMSVLLETNPTLANSLDLSFIAAKLDSIKQFNMVSISESVLEGEVKNSMGIKKKDVRLVALIAVFLILFLVLIYMVYTTFFVSKPKPKVNYPIKKNIVSPTPIPVSSPSSALELTPVP